MSFDLKSLILQHEHQVHDSGGHLEYAIQCPNCLLQNKIDKKLWINLSTGLFLCYRCGLKGNQISLVSRLLKVSWKEALKIVRGDEADIDFLRLSLTNEEEGVCFEDPKIKPIELPYGFVPISESKTAASDYLLERGIPLEYAIERGWGYASIGFCENRIIVPFFINYDVCFWQARWIGTPPLGIQKVLNPKGISARSILYNYDVAKKFEKGVLVEGFVDAVKVGDHAMAINGKQVHCDQISLLKESDLKKITLLLDRDVEPKILKYNYELLSVHFETKVAILPDTRDPGSYPYKSSKLQSIIEAAKAY